MLGSLLQELPDSYSAVKTEYPWKHLYLQQNLQELVGKLNDNPDFPVSGLVTSCVPCLHSYMLSLEWSTRPLVYSTHVQHVPWVYSIQHGCEY